MYISLTNVYKPVGIGVHQLSCGWYGLCSLQKSVPSRRATRRVVMDVQQAWQGPLGNTSLKPRKRQSVRTNKSSLTDFRCGALLTNCGRLVQLLNRSGMVQGLALKQGVPGDTDQNLVKENHGDYPILTNRQSPVISSPHSTFLAGKGP